MKILRADEERMHQLLAEPEDVHAFIEDPRYPEVDIDKSWHSIHYALTGELWGGEGSAAFIQVGGTPLGDEDIGFGPARVFFADEVAEISQVVSSLSEKDFRAALERDEAKRVHGSHGSPVTDQTFAYDARHLAALKIFLQESSGSAILLALT